MYTEISIEYGQNKCAQKLLSSMDKINVHRNFYEYGNKKCAQKFLSIMDKINVHRKNDDRLEDSQMG